MFKADGDENKRSYHRKPKEALLLKPATWNVVRARGGDVVNSTPPIAKCLLNRRGESLELARNSGWIASRGDCTEARKLGNKSSVRKKNRYKWTFWLFVSKATWREIPTPRLCPKYDGGRQLKCTAGNGLLSKCSNSRLKAGGWLISHPTRPISITWGSSPTTNPLKFSSSSSFWQKIISTREGKKMNTKPFSHFRRHQ